MNRILSAMLMALLLSVPAFAADGVINVQSRFGVAETADRLENIVKSKGMKVFGRVAHSQSAAGVGIELRDTLLLIFGNPKVGSPMMKCRQTVGLDLPQKALIWKDGDGSVWISYNDQSYLKRRHAVEGCEAEFAKPAKALAGMTKAASGN